MSDTPLQAAGNLVPEEQDLAKALIEIADKYGKFDEDQTGIWADYHEPEDNPYAEMGVKCGNCVLYRGGQECAVVAFKVDPEGYCRFAVLPDGTVDPSKAPEGTKPFERHELAPVVADADYGGKCPPATQDIVLNIKNRQNAIDNVGYGPLNPDEPNEEFWQDKADRWNITPVEASKSICGNCVFFDRRSKTLECIETGIAEGGSGDDSAWGAIDQAELGYCTALDFKCAASRTCNAWAAGGPVTDESMQAGGYKVGEDVDVEVEKFFKKPVYALPKYLKAYAEEADEDDEYEIELDDLVPTQQTVNMRRVEDVTGSDKPIKVWINEDGEPEIIDGHHRSVAYKVNGNKTIRAKVYKASGFTATAGSRRAPKKDRIYGSRKNKKGSASGTRKIVFSKRVEDTLREKVRTHNEKTKAAGRKATLGALKAAYRRGAGAFSSSHRPGQNRNSWAMARVNAYLHLLRTGSPKNKNYVQDNDLLPSAHPRSSKGTTAAAFDPELELTIELRDEMEYDNPEHALLAFAEYSGMGYEIIPALRTAWLRAAQNDEPAFERAMELAIDLYESRDADLLPRRGEAN